MIHRAEIPAYQEGSEVSITIVLESHNNEINHDNIELRIAGYTGTTFQT